MKIYNYKRMIKHINFLEQADAGYISGATSEFMEDLIKSWNDEHPDSLISKRTFNCGNCMLDRAKRYYTEMKEYEQLKTKKDV